MSTTIKINVSGFNKEDIVTTFSAVFSDGSAKYGEITAAFNELLPWANTASSEAFDFFHISSVVYGIDRFIPRRANSVDGWSRQINIELPVYNVAKWKASKNILEKLLSFLTGDYWTINFYKNTLSLSKKELSEIYKVPIYQVSLFSGGLDSLIGAIDTLENSKKPTLFVSHYDSFMHGPKKDQNELTIEMNKHYGTKFIHIPSVKVYLSQTNVGARETTSRSRSLLFIGLALLTAEPKDVNIIVPENGTVSLNYPLSPSRRSSCSTRTTHPTFLMYVEQIFGELGIKTKIENPYKFRTKGEMVKSCSNKVLLEKILTQSNSCGKRGHRAHWDASGTHCGICMPCIYRRSALINGDKTPYGNQINALNKNSIFTKKWQDVGSMLDFLHEKADTNKLKFELISNGLQDQPNLYNYIDLIRRTKKELSNWIKSKGNTFVKTKAGL